MISHADKCIFVHQRKCAGVSIINAFGIANGSPEWDLFNDGTQSPEWTNEADLVSRYVTFAVVRNPWDRFVSGWKYCASTRDRTLLDVLRHPPEEGHDYRHVTRPQHLTLYDERGELAVDHLVRFEALDAGFAAVCRVLGKEPVALPRHNAGNRPDYHDVFDAEARRLFDARFGDDIDRFGYRY